jgi:hypothetical protein
VQHDDSLPPFKQLAQDDFVSDAEPGLLFFPFI